MAHTITESPGKTERRLRMSYEEYVNVVDDTTHSEWVDGEVTIFMPPTWRHQQLSRFLLMLFGMFLESKRLGEIVAEPFEMKLRAGRSYREPDLLVVLNDHLDRVDTQRLNGPADIVVELVSPESATRDRQEKLREYDQEGIGEYWIVDAREEMFAVECYGRDDTGSFVQCPADAANRIHSRVLPGFWLDLGWFADGAIPRATEVYAEFTRSTT